MSTISIKDLSRRLLVSSVSMVFVGLLIYFSQNRFFMPVFALFLLLVTFAGIYEYIKMLEKKNVFLKKSLMFFCAFFQVFSFFLYSQISGFKLLPVFALFLAVFLIFISRFNKIESSASYVSLSSFGILYIAVPLGLLFPILYFREHDGRLWLIYLIAVTKIADIGGYFGGKLLGRHKLAPRISPNKTIEGAITGLLFSIALSYLFFYFFNDNPNFYFKLSPTFFLVLGAVLGTLGQIGDLAESLLKRDAGIKDSNTLPGLGGILDMLDSLLFNIPFLFFFLEAVI